VLVTIKWTKESAESIIRKYQEVVEQLNGQEAPPIEDIFKNIQDGFDNISEEAIINIILRKHHLHYC
jgi:L-arabinose isomerase